MTKLPSVSVVILNWNGLNYLQQFLPSVFASTYPNLRIIVGDNASTDSSVEFIRANYPQIEVITNDNNYGFAGGYNKVLDQIDSDYFILLNSDVEVQPQWIQPVIDLMESDAQIATAQPKILSYKEKDKFEHAGAAGGFLDMFGYPFCRGRIFDSVESDNGQYDDVKEIFWASGAALFIKRDKWIEVGGLDADFFAHMEEIDLCWRLKNNGYKVIYCPDSVVYHVGGGTLDSENPFKTYLNFRNNLFLIQKNLSFFHASIIIFIRLWLDLVSLLKFLYDGRPKHARAINKAHTAFLKAIFKTGKKASKISTARFNGTALVNKSIVWQYFVQKKKTFNSL
ncbi:glycosyltransferase family 2 protein [Daejeonella sp.]|uniref:glycosyltransferase family 2 protein n=1 Tax=Daejeonella sp. TaxID=2805397 RepID=UPI0030BBD8D5